MNKEDILKMAAIYKGMHEASGFQVDMPVVITTKAATLENGWCAGWLPAMDKYVGKTGYIIRDNKEVGFFIEFDDGVAYNFPCFVLEKGVIVEEEFIELPFLKGRYYATEAQEDTLFKNLLDISDSKLGNVPWIVVDAEGNILRDGMREPCLGALHSASSTKRSPKMNKNPVLFLRWYPRYASNGGMKKAAILEYHDYLKNFSPWVQYIVHFKNKKLDEHFFGIRLKDVPSNLPLMLGTHARMPWDSYLTEYSFEYNELSKEAPKASPGELLIVSSMVYCERDTGNRDSAMFQVKVKSGGHCLWGGSADPHVFKEYLDGELNKVRYDSSSFKMYSGHGSGVEEPFSLITTEKMKEGINEFLTKTLYKKKIKRMYGDNYISHLNSVEARCENVSYIINAIKGL